MRVVIMQPYYLPYRGYFALLSAADVFVIYDDVQYRHRFWQSRNRLKVGPSWWTMTVPVRTKGRRHQLIREVEIDGNRWQKSHLGQIKKAYARAPYFRTVYSQLAEVLEREWRYLVDLNVTLIRLAFSVGGGKLPEMIYSSQLGVPNTGRTEREVAICRLLGASEYISGTAAKAYMKPELWRIAGIRLAWFIPDLVPYPCENYEPYASIVDVLFWQGQNAWNYVEGHLIYEDEVRSEPTTSA